MTLFNKISDTEIIPDTWFNGVILSLYIYKTKTANFVF